MRAPQVPVPSSSSSTWSVKLLSNCTQWGLQVMQHCRHGVNPARCWTDINPHWGVDGSSEHGGIWPWITFCSWDLALAAMQSSSPGAGDRTGLKLCQLFWSLSRLTCLKKKRCLLNWKERKEKKAGKKNPITISLQLGIIRFIFKKTTTLLCCEPSWTHAMHKRFKWRVLQIN